MPDDKADSYWISEKGSSDMPDDKADNYWISEKDSVDPKGHLDTRWTIQEYNKLIYIRNLRVCGLSYLIVLVFDS